MQPQTHKSVLFLIAGLFSIGAMPASAHEAGKANAGYIGDSSGHLAIDSRGKCTRTAHWTRALALPECEGGKAAVATTPAPAKVAAPEPAPVAAVVAPKPAPKSISLDAMTLFDVNSSNLRSTAKVKLGSALSEMTSTKASESIAITGHADNSGSNSFNQALSEKRAQGVADYLIGKGVPANVITTTGKGEADPVASNDTAEGRAKNRRVEIDFVANQ